MSNSTHPPALIQERPSTLVNAIIDMVIFLSTTLLLAVVIPLFIIERKQPMVRHRSWTINILACISAGGCSLSRALLFMDNWIGKDMRATAYSINYILYSSTQTPIAICVAAISVLQIFFSIVFLLWYGPRSPKDNYHIMTQFYIITVITLVSVAINLISEVSQNQSIFSLCNSFSDILAFLAIVVDIVVPLQFLFTKTRYHMDVSPSQLEALIIDEAVGSSHRVHGDTNLKDKSYSESQNKIFKSAYHSPVDTGQNACQLHRSVKYTLDRILAEPTLYQAFCVFLSHEFSLESLLFIEAVKSYKEKVKQNPSKATVELLSTKLYDDFIAPNSVNEVNLPKRIATKLEGELYVMIDCDMDMDKAIAIYDCASTHIHQMLISNHLRKFLASSLFKNATSDK
ncbi:hypothetical protein BASA50_008939 [Batrachochytrium salamandrivorans]|uniref:RGS domain-containing protein n=1 Tax=Batrachochytrium salamandrivorans TaxID=1357716 RepID=A0ABQ8F2V2_9FUNG|nr:hypothetical protein BASA50_008939 [Batrachochytrium salamandrivorans]KAH9277202.1 hypothetical protein BASA83_000064 [Batrachochytrium salamandrivorans]